MAPQLRTLAALLEDPGLVPAPTLQPTTTHSSSSRGPELCGNQARRWYIRKHEGADKTLIQQNQINKKTVLQCNVNKETGKELLKQGAGKKCSSNSGSDVWLSNTPGSSCRENLQQRRRDEEENF